MLWIEVALKFERLTFEFQRTPYFPPYVKSFIFEIMVMFMQITCFERPTKLKLGPNRELWLIIVMFVREPLIPFIMMIPALAVVKFFG